MVKIVVGGQLAKDEMAALIRQCGGGEVNVEIKSDMQAAMDVKSGAADFYVGACQTGGGGSLAMAIALCGYGVCVTLASAGNVMSEERIAAEVQAGKTCFGLVVESMQTVVPVLVRKLLKQKTKKSQP